MKATSKVKLFISLAIVFIVILLAGSVWQLVAINKKQKIINAQQAEIERLTNMNKYYEEHEKNGSNPGGSEITQAED